MIGVPVPRIRICACRAAGDGTGDAWANSSGARVNATMSTAALTGTMRHSGERANDERLMLVSRVRGRQTLSRTRLDRKRSIPVARANKLVHAFCYHTSHTLQFDQSHTPV